VYLSIITVILEEHLPGHLGNKLVKSKFPRLLNWQR